MCVYSIERNAMISDNDIKGTNDVHSTATGECYINFNCKIICKIHSVPQ